MYNVEPTYRIGKARGYQCRRCGRLLGEIYDGDEYSDSGFEEWNFCPFCGTLLDC